MSNITDSFSEEERKETKTFCDFYINLIEKHSAYIKHHLADDVTLDWFGQTVKGIKNVSAFIKNNVVTNKHLFANAQPVSTIGYRDTHNINDRKNHKNKVIPTNYNILNREQKTPPKNTVPDPSTSQEQGQGDGIHNCDDPPMSPIKRGRFDHGDGEETLPVKINTKEMLPVKYMSVTGSIEFHKHSSKKLQSETKWERPSKLEIAYTCNTVEDCTIHLIIYHGNMKCRRNLLKDFDKGEPQD